MPFHALGGSWRLRPFFCATRENAVFQRGVFDKTYRSKCARVRCRWFEPNAPGRLRKAAVADVFGAYGMPYEWGRLSGVSDAGSCLRSMSAWSVAREGRGGFWLTRRAWPRVSAKVAFMLFVICYTDYILILY